MQVCEQRWGGCGWGACGGLDPQEGTDAWVSVEGGLASALWEEGQLRCPPAPGWPQPQTEVSEAIFSRVCRGTCKDF